MKRGLCVSLNTGADPSPLPSPLPKGRENRRQSLPQTKGDAPSLVGCPKSVMDNWHAEAAKFAPSLRVKPWAAAQLASLPKQLDTADIHVINYSQLRLLGESLIPIRWRALILDEGQYIKN